MEEESLCTPRIECDSQLSETVYTTTESASLTHRTEYDSLLSHNIDSTATSDNVDLQGVRDNTNSDNNVTAVSESMVTDLCKSPTEVVEVNDTVREQEEAKSETSARNENLKSPSNTANSCNQRTMEDANRYLESISDGMVDIPFNKGKTEKEVKSCRSSLSHESYTEGDSGEPTCLLLSSTHSLSDDQNPEDNIKPDRVPDCEDNRFRHCTDLVDNGVKSLQKTVSEDVDHAATAVHKIPQDTHRGTADDQVKDSLKDQQQVTPSHGESPTEIQKNEPLTHAQKTLINVYITWTDSETGGSTWLKWDHPSCDVCCSNFADWKQHVEMDHGTFEMKSKKKSTRRKKTIPKLRIPRKDVKLEPSDDTSQALNISIPALVSLRSLGEKAHKMETQDLSDSLKATENTKQLYIPDIDDEASCEMSDSFKVVPKKRGWKSRTMVKEEDSVVVTFKRKPGRPKKKKEDEDDPEYIPAGTRHLRPKKPVEYHPKKLFACGRDDCGLMFEKWKDCKAHERDIHGDEMFKCGHEGCGRMFKIRYRRDQHETSHTTEIKRKKEGYKCNYCYMVFRNAKDRAFHSKTHVSFKCGFEGCERSYTTRTEMRRHQKLHNAERVFPCPLCQKKFIGPKYVNRHLKTHRDKTFGCDQCHKSFKTALALTRHKRLHTGQGLLVCQFCGKKLNGKSSLDRHERLHRGETPYKCEFCDKSFVCCNSLQTHVQEHTGYQFVCAQCGHKFKSKGNLLEHERSHTGETPYSCNKCGRTYRTASGLWTHHHARHSDTKRHKCEICSKMFWTHGALYKHRKVHTGERNSECKYCHKRFGNSSTRAGHIRQVHMGIKRTGHQGKAKRIKDEAMARKLLQEAKELKENPQNLLSNHGAKSENEASASTNSKATKTQDVRIMEDKSGSMVALPMMPLASRGRLPGMHHMPSQIPPSHNPAQAHGDPSRSDFYTMVESFIQFSKEH